MNILIVDDSTVARMITRRSTQELFADSEIMEAKSGPAALELLEAFAGEIELALIDYNMPEMDGLEFAEMLDKLHPETRQVLCTANAQEGLQRRAEAQGMGVLHKPVSTDRLRDFLDQNRRAA